MKRPADVIGAAVMVGRIATGEIEDRKEKKVPKAVRQNRQNLTMRMSMRRFTRLANAFSKKFDNHCHALALYFARYNLCALTNA